MQSWRHAGRILQGLREGRGWTVPMFVAELKKFASSYDRIGAVLAAWPDETNRLPPQRPRPG